MNSLRLVILLFALFLSNFLFGQQHSFLQYSSKDGLPQSQINDIVQDNEGFLWIATNGGLSRFDGKRFKNYSTLNGLKVNEVRFLDIDSDGLLWMADLKGLSSFDGHEFRHFNFEENVRSIVSLYCDGDKIWVSTRQGLYKFENALFELIKLSDDPDFRINSIYRDKGKLWFFANDSAFTFTPENTAKKSLKIPWVKRVVKKDNDVFMITVNKGLFKNFNDSQSVLYEQAGLEEDLVRDMAVSKNGDLWISTTRKLLKWDGNELLQIDQKRGLPYNDVITIFVDSDDVLWLGTDGNGLYKYAGNLITTYTTKDNLSSNLVMGISQLSNSLYTISYDEGLNKITKNKVESVDLPSNTLLGNGWSITSDGNGIWTGFSNGLVFTNDHHSKLYTTDEGMIDNYVLSLFWDKDTETLHIGSRNGWTEFNNGTFKKNPFREGFPINRVRFINRDSEGKLWFAGINGVARYDGNTFVTYTDSSGLPSRSTYNIEFYNGKTWIGTNNGLCYIEDEIIKTVSLGSNLKDLNINLLKNDERGYLWIGTNNGIYALKIDENNAIRLRHFGMQNGLLGLETNLNASYLDTDGNVFFGMEQGLVRIDRNEFDHLEMQDPPRLVLTDLQVYLKDVNWKERGDSLTAGSFLPVDLKLKPNENYLTFNFSGINMHNPDDIRYRFMLKGAEGELASDWSTPTKNNFATFSNLHSGDYEFMVQASNGVSFWPEEFLSYTFTIKTPFYATWWFRSLVFAFIILSAYTFYSWRLRTIRQEQENLRLRSQSKMLALEQQTLNANMNRHFVFNALNSIQYYLNKEDKISANRYLSRFAKLIRKNLDSSQTKQTTLHEEIDRMVLYMELEQMRFAHKFDFEFKIDQGINTREVDIPSMLFQPYLENSIWHGILPMEDHGRIEVEIKNLENNSISIRIFDNGIGIETSLKHKIEKKDHISVGMDITKNRLSLYEQLSKRKATVIGPYEVVENGHTTGTMVELILPLLNDSTKLS